MNELDVLAKKYGTDKQTNGPGENKYHGYTPTFHNLFKDERSNYKNILEIGVREGWSHKMWYDYFTEAMIYGVDNMEDPVIANIPVQELLNQIENDRIKVFVGSQDDEQFLNESFGDIEFDLILDDGSHRSWHHQKTFKYLFPRLKSGGYYIIEDLGVCGIREFREYDDVRSSTTSWLSGIQRGEFFSYYIDNGQDYMDQIETVQLVGELGIIKKR